MKPEIKTPDELINEAAEKIVTAVQDAPIPVAAAACCRVMWYAADKSPHLKPLIVSALRSALEAMSEPEAGPKAH